jgi:hypothetical protein
MTRSEKKPGDDFEADDWESARRRALTLALAATPAQRLAWLEEAIEVARASGALPKPRPDST